MNVTITPKTIRTLLPIRVEITEVSSAIPLVEVSPTGDKNAHATAFSAEVKPLAEGAFLAEFWLEAQGPYEIRVSANDTTTVEKINVEQQTFLPFFQEIGVFSFLFAVMAAGVILWLRFTNQKTHELSSGGSTSSSLPR